MGIQTRGLILIFILGYLARMISAYSGKVSCSRTCTNSQDNLFSYTCSGNGNCNCGNALYCNCENTGTCNCEQSTFCSCSNNGNCNGQSSEIANSSVICNSNNGECNCGLASKCTCNSFKECCVNPNTKYTFPYGNLYGTKTDSTGCVSKINLSTGAIVGIVIGSLIFIGVGIRLYTKYCKNFSFKRSPNIALADTQKSPQEPIHQPQHQRNELIQRDSTPPTYDQYASMNHVETRHPNPNLPAYPGMPNP